MKNSPLFSIIAGIVAVIALVMMAKSLIDSHAVPSLGEYLASSTEMMASSTTYSIDSSTNDDSIATGTDPSIGGASDSASKSISSAKKLPMTDILAPNGMIHAMVAANAVDEEKGLGDRDPISADSGMIFIFSKPGAYAFWMKDMRFSLDMVWIDASKRVVGVTGGISPDTYPNVFLSPSAVSYVLELNAGAASRYGIATGTLLTFSLVK